MVRLDDLANHIDRRYENPVFVGKGGMGIVFRARDRELDRWVAIKMILPGRKEHPDLVARFRREAQAMAQFSHDNIVHVHDVRLEPWPFFVTEYLEGQTLEARLKSGALDDGEFFRTVLPLLRALEQAHRAGIIHRDIKPGNIFLSRDGRPVWLDFGLAHVDSMTSLTSPGQAFGTLIYMAPEQLDADSSADHRSDLYSLGLTLYEMLAGKLPFERGFHLTKIRGFIVDPEALGRLRGRVLAPILQKLLSVDPEQRPESAEALHQELEKARNLLAEQGWRVRRLLDEFEALAAEGIHALTAKFALARFLEGAPDQFGEAFLNTSHLETIRDGLAGPAGVLARLDRISELQQHVDLSGAGRSLRQLTTRVESTRTFFHRLLTDTHCLLEAIARGDRPRDLLRFQEQVGTLGRSLRSLHQEIRQEMDRFRVDLSGLLAEMVRRFESRGVVFSMDSSVDATLTTLDVSGVRRDLQTVFDNLLENSFQAGARNLRMRWTSSEDCGDWILEIEDDGSGLPVRDPEILFRGSYTTKEEGTGSGLVRCRHILSGYGASLRLYPGRSRGARAVLTLPRNPPVSFDPPTGGPLP